MNAPNALSSPTCASGVDELLYSELVDELSPGGERARLLATVDEYLDEFAAFCRSVHVLGEVTPRAMDAITSLGERINARLMAAVLCLRGTFGKAVDATELIVTDDTFQNAVPLPKAPLIAVSLSSSQPTLPPARCSKFIGR